MLVSNHFLPIPSRRLDIFDAFARMRFGIILVLADEGVRVRLLLEVAQGMVDLPVLGFVGTDVVKQIAHGAVTLRHVPILHRNLRCLEALPLWEFPSFDVSNGTGVGENCFFFQVADKTMADPGRHQVGQEHAIVEDPLRSEDHEPHKATWFSHLHEGEEMHALVIGLFKEGFDPVDHVSRTLQRRSPHDLPSVVSLEAP